MAEPILDPTPEPNPLLAAAIGYAGELNWPVLPLHAVRDGKCSCGDAACVRSAGKHPRTKNGVNDATTDPTVLRGWWPRWPDANVGVATGTRSGVLMIGPDGAEGIRDFTTLEGENGAFPLTPVAQSGNGGWHVLTQFPGDVGLQANHLGAKIDLRGEGGYFVAAPSVSGYGSYRWINDPFTTPLTTCPPGWAAWCRRKKPPKPAAPHPQPPARPPQDRARVVERARKYLATLDPSVEGQNGHDTLFAAARHLRTGFDLGIDEAFPLLQAYNARALPPWPEADLWRKLRECDEHPGDMARGAHVNKPFDSTNGYRPPGTGPSSEPPPSAAPRKPRFEFLTDAAFVTGDYRPEFLITNVLVKGQPGGIGGPIKAMKTGLSVDMALSLGTGAAFLGEFAVPRAVTTVMVSGESGRGTLLETRDRVMRAKGFSPGRAFDTLHWCFDVPCLSDAAAMAEFTELLVARAPEVVILDPLYLMLGDVNAASMFETGNLLRTVAGRLLAAGITTVICHHAHSRLEIGKPMELHHLSHAGFSQFVGQYVLINRRREYVKGTGRHELIVGIGGRDGYGGQYHVDIEEGVADESFRGRRWDVRVTNTADERKAPVEDREAKKTKAEQEKGAAKRAKFLAHVDAEQAKGFPAVSANKLRTDYGWQYADIKAIAECLMLDGEIEPHKFTFRAGKGAPQETTGFRRPVPPETIPIPFGHQPVDGDQPVFSAAQPGQPADPGDGAGNSRISRFFPRPNRVNRLIPVTGQATAGSAGWGNPLYRGSPTGEPADAGHPRRRRRGTEPKTGDGWPTKKTG